MPDNNTVVAGESRVTDVGTFLAELRAKPVGLKGRLIFGLDATWSRSTTWDAAASLQASMFKEASSIGALSLQLAYYRGASECKASGWVEDSAKLAMLMSKIDCRPGATQVEKILAHALKETARQKVTALVFVGDKMEEDADILVAKARELGRIQTPVFMVQEGHDRLAESVFKQMAAASGGAYAKFDEGGIKKLGETLRAVAVFVTGGVQALEGRKDEAGRLLLGRMKRGG
jgi:hypothetical protein